MNTTTQRKKKEIHLPDTYLMILVIMLIVAVLSYIMPAGTYEKMRKPIHLKDRFSHF